MFERGDLWRHTAAGAPRVAFPTSDERDDASASLLLPRGRQGELKADGGDGEVSPRRCFMRVVVWCGNRRGEWYVRHVDSAQAMNQPRHDKLVLCRAKVSDVARFDET